MIYDGRQFKAKVYRLSSSPTKIPNQSGKTGGIDASTSLSIDSRTGEPGGIDFRTLPVVTQPALINNPFLRDSPLPVFDNSLRPSTSLGTPFGRRGQSLPNINLDTEWQQIQKMLNAGITPSTERIKEYVQACSQSANINEEIDKVLSCIADILRLEEESCLPTEAGLKELLVSLESS